MNLAKHQEDTSSTTNNSNAAGVGESNKASIDPKQKRKSFHLVKEAAPAVEVVRVPPAASSSSLETNLTTNEEDTTATTRGNYHELPPASTANERKTMFGNVPTANEENDDIIGKKKSIDFSNHSLFGGGSAIEKKKDQGEDEGSPKRKLEGPPSRRRLSLNLGKSSTNSHDHGRKFHHPTSMDSSTRSFTTMLSSSSHSSRVVESSFEIFRSESNAVLSTINEYWGVEASGFNLQMDDPLTQSKLTNVSEAILVSESWNKVLAFRSMFAEALIGRWRVLVATEEVQMRSKNLDKAFWVQNILSATQLRQTESNVRSQVLRMIETNSDPIAKHFGTRTNSLAIFCIGALDAAVQDLCPHRVMQREAYRPLQGSADPDPSVSGAFFHENECTNFKDFCKHFGRYSVRPRHWLVFCKAFLWAMKGHNPYSLEDEQDDLVSSTNDSAHAKFVAGMVALPIIEASLRRECHVRDNIVFKELQIVCSWHTMANDFENVSTNAMTVLFHNFPDIHAHFSDNDAEEVLSRLFQL